MLFTSDWYLQGVYYISPLILQRKGVTRLSISIQTMLTNNEIDFLGNDEWTGGSPDLNPPENLEVILMDRVDTRIRDSKANQNYATKTLKKITKKVLNELANDTELLEKLIMVHCMVLKNNF